jgi:hypothetical protein
MESRGLLILLLLALLAACAQQPRTIVAEPLDKHDRETDHAYCLQYAQKYGVINMDPLMSGSGMEDFPDNKRQIQLYESCMMKKGYRFQ